MRGMCYVTCHYGRSEREQEEQDSYGFHQRARQGELGGGGGVLFRFFKRERKFRERFEYSEPHLYSVE